MVGQNNIPGQEGTATAILSEDAQEYEHVSATACVFLPLLI